jgi:DNA-binding transcriptional regulator GbsR (MarR family)
MEMNINALNKSIAEMRKLREQNLDNAPLVAQADFDISKMTQALQYYRWLDRFIDSLESGQIFEWIPKEES